MCQLSEISKAGTKQNSTRIVECCFFSTGLSSECIANSRTCGLRKRVLFPSVTIFSQCFVPWSFLHGVWIDLTI